MNEQHELSIELKHWVEKAEHDLRNAEYVLTLKDDCPTDTVCFHAQQCAEKYLKVLLISRLTDFPKTHDLVLLLNLLGGAESLGLYLRDIQPLNRYSVEARYPGDWNPIDMDEATRAVTQAQAIRNAVRNLLPANVL